MCATDWSDASNILLCRSCWKGLHPRTSSMEVEIFAPSQLYISSPPAEESSLLSLPSASSWVLPRWWMKGGGGPQGVRGSGGKRIVSGILLGNFSNEFAAIDGIERLWKVGSRGSVPWSSLSSVTSCSSPSIVSGAWVSFPFVLRFYLGF